MPATLVALIPVAETGGLIAEANSDVANGNSFSNADESVFVVVRNSGVGNAATATFVAQDVSQVVNGFGTMTKASIAVTCTAGQEKFVGPFPHKAFNDASDLVQVTYSGADAADLRMRFVTVPGLKKV